MVEPSFARFAGAVADVVFSSFLFFLLPYLFIT